MITLGAREWLMSRREYRCENRALSFRWSATAAPLCPCLSGTEALSTKDSMGELGNLDGRGIAADQSGFARDPEGRGGVYLSSAPMPPRSISCKRSATLA